MTCAEEDNQVIGGRFSRGRRMIIIRGKEESKMKEREIIRIVWGRRQSREGEEGSL